MASPVTMAFAPVTRAETAADENGTDLKKWCFQGNKDLQTASEFTVRTVLQKLMKNTDPNELRPTIPLAHGDPSVFPSFRVPRVAEVAITDALRSAKFNCYAPSNGVLPARRAVANYLSRDLPCELSEDDVFITVGCMHAIEIILTVLARPGANILLPRPGFPNYEARTACCHIEARHFDLLPQKGWEVDLEAVETLADQNTVAIVIINPGNPCGNVYSRKHLKKIAETARKLGILVIADEVYAHITFGKDSFVPMGSFGSVVPVITVGSISKRWVVPGWRIGWLVIHDLDGILRKTGVIDSIERCADVSSNPPTFVQGALPQILETAEKHFFSKINGLIKESADFLDDAVKNNSCLTCPSKPEGSMFAMVKLNTELLTDIEDDLDFCLKLAREESVLVLPGIAVGLKNWLRLSIAVEPSVLEEGLERIRCFCQRHAN